MSFRSFGLAVVFVASSYACGGDPPAPPRVPLREAEPLKTGLEQKERLCNRGRTDRVIAAFCGAEHGVSSLVDLRRVLGIDSHANDIYQGFVLTGHSTSLSSHIVSAINPRAILIGPHGEGDEPVFLAFARGEQFVEIVARDDTNTLQFYLVAFRQECNERDGGCTPGDLLTPAIESGWLELDVYAEEDLENTPRDCRVCHQPAGPGTPKLLRMQELEPPWNHWFWRQAIGGRAVLGDYFEAKGEEDFAGIPGAQIIGSQPGLLSAALRSLGSQDQPNAFVSATIEQEVMRSAAAEGGNQPEDNSIPGQSPTWDVIYARAKRGEAISVPYHDVKVTDAAKLERMTAAYQELRAGTIERDELPDITDVYPDDPQIRAEIGLETEPGLDGQGVLLQACAQCHNRRLEQGISRARFDVELSRLDPVAKAVAITRINLPDSDPGKMPPSFARQLSEDGKDRLIELLRK